MEALSKMGAIYHIFTLEVHRLLSQVQSLNQRCRLNHIESKIRDNFYHQALHLQIQSLKVERGDSPHISTVLGVGQAGSTKVKNLIEKITLLFTLAELSSSFSSH
jgi:hypothetical protein